MGLEGLSLRHLLVVLVIVALVFGTKKLRNAGGDLGAAMKSFRRAMRDHDEEEGSVAAAERASLGQDSQDAGHAARSSAAKSAERS